MGGDSERLGEGDNDDLDGRRGLDTIGAGMDSDGGVGVRTVALPLIAGGFSNSSEHQPDELCGEGIHILSGEGENVGTSKGERGLD